MTRKEILSHETGKRTIESIRDALLAKGDSDTTRVEDLIELLDRVAAGAMGRFVMENSGFNGYWTDYMIEHPREGRITGLNREGDPMDPMEKHMLDTFPTILATQERADHFATQIQRRIREGVVMGSMPCGLMRDLLARDYTGLKHFELVGMDLDPESLQHAEALAQTYGLREHTQFIETDAWALKEKERFHLLASNGLNIYVEDDQRVTALYRVFHRALKPNGVLITSCVTPPPVLDPASEWDLGAIDMNALLEQKMVFSEVIQAAWQQFRGTDLTRLQLLEAGFAEVEVIYDKARMFPTFVAKK